MQKRRYEILLPLTHSDGRPVADEKLFRTREDLVALFGPTPCSTITYGPLARIARGGAEKAEETLFASSHVPGDRRGGPPDG